MRFYRCLRLSLIHNILVVVLAPVQNHKAVMVWKDPLCFGISEKGDRSIVP